MARKTFNVLFFIKKARLLKNGEAPATRYFWGGNFIHFLGISIATITGLYRLGS